MASSSSLPANWSSIVLFLSTSSGHPMSLSLSAYGPWSWLAWLRTDRINSWELPISQSPAEKRRSWGTGGMRAACVGKQMSDFIRLICVGVCVHVIASVKEAWKLPIIWCTHLRTVPISKENLLSQNDSSNSSRNNNRKPTKLLLSHSYLDASQTLWLHICMKPMWILAMATFSRIITNQGYP